MPIAAVPNYLGQDFREASPGMRFGMYLTLWGINRQSQALLWETSDIGYEVRGPNRQEREVRYENKVAALNHAKLLNNNDKIIMRAVFLRQQLAFDAAAAPKACLRLEATTTAPFTTGLGNEHPLENGFAFLNPYGLPYLPGSGVKGVLRQAARELTSGEWDDTHGWSEDKTWPLMQGEGEKRKPVLDKHKQPVKLSMLDVLFGLESQDGETEHVRGALSFWDVIPQIKGNELTVEIMTPHQAHYYQQNQRDPTAGSANPHDSGQPTPITFLTVPPGSDFAFYMPCDLARLKRLAPDLTADERWKTLMRAAFEHAFDWLGFGAKTSVGYGAMMQKELTKSSPNGDAKEGGGNEILWPTAKLSFNPGSKEIWATFEKNTTARLKDDKADEIFTRLGEQRANKLRKAKELKAIAVRVSRQGNVIRLVGLA